MREVVRVITVVAAEDGDCSVCLHCLGRPSRGELLRPCYEVSIPISNPDAWPPRSLRGPFLFGHLATAAHAAVDTAGQRIITVNTGHTLDQERYMHSRERSGTFPIAVSRSPAFFVAISRASGRHGRMGFGSVPSIAKCRSTSVLAPMRGPARITTQLGHSAQ